MGGLKMGNPKSIQNRIVYVIWSRETFGYRVPRNHYPKSFRKCFSASGKSENVSIVGHLISMFRYIPLGGSRSSEKDEGLWNGFSWKSMNDHEIIWIIIREFRSSSIGFQENHSTLVLSFLSLKIHGVCIYIYIWLYMSVITSILLDPFLSGPTAAYGFWQMEDLLAKMLICTPSTWFTIITGQPCGSAFRWFFVAPVKH